MDLRDSSTEGEHAAVVDDMVKGLLVMAALASCCVLMRHLCIRCLHCPYKVLMQFMVVH